MGLLRTFLALLVVAAHTWGYSSKVDIGLLAVAVFFVISGYLMPLTFQRNYHSARRFYVNRALRIYPLYWIALTIWVVEVLVTKRFDYSGTAILLNYVLLGIDGPEHLGLPYIVMAPAWTLNLELQFYLLVPLMLLALNRSKAWHYLIGAGAVVCFIIWLLAEGWTTNWGRWLVPWFFFFYIGFSLYLYRLERWAPLALVVVPFGGTEFALWLGLAVLAALLLERQKNGLFGKIDNYIGEFSFPLYVLHWPLLAVLLAALGKDKPYLLLLTVNVIACLVASWVALHMISFPIDGFRRSIQKFGYRVALKRLSLPHRVLEQKDT